MTDSKQRVVRRAWLPQTARQDITTLRRGLSMVFAMAPRCAAAATSLRLVEALLPALHVWLLKWIIDTVAAAHQSPTLPAASSRTTLLLAGSYLLLVCVQQTIGVASRLLQGHIRDLIAGQVTLRVMEKAANYPDLTPFESPLFYDRLQRFRNEAAWQPMNLFNGLGGMAQSLLTLLCMLVFLAQFHPVLVLVLVVGAGPSVLSQRRIQEAVWCYLAEITPLRRRLADYAQMLLTAPYAKEVRLFGFSGHLLGRYQELFTELTGHLQRTRTRAARTSMALSLLAALGISGAFAYVIHQAQQGRVTLGDLSLYTGALLQANSAALGVVGALAMLHETLPYMRELFGFLDGKPTMSIKPLGKPAALNGSALGRSRGKEGFRLERIAFRYPGTERLVFSHLDLEIPWGKTTAVVGENGAGKSTLVKLLTRLYDPIEGRVLLDGVDLRDYDVEELRRQIAIVFQDFARYQLPVWENIGLGNVDYLHDRRRIAEAARQAGADAVIHRLPQGDETLLGREFEGGVELSGGEWQKIALARAFMRDAPFLILDEPTAALDPRSEYEIYQRFLELAAGRTTLLISHRFSTVRMADRILVLEHGEMIEEGDHRSLMGQGGRYAELYAMQAERYGL
jgi:ATP-binding cassette, subfamily B, bacterial